MADQAVLYTPGSGANMQAFRNTVATVVVDSLATTLVDQFGVPIGTVANNFAVYSPDATGSGTITTTDIVVAVPAGDGTYRSGASTAGSYYTLRCPGGDSGWAVGITGLTTGTLYFEGSPDSTNGADGNWINISGRRAGLLQTQISGNAVANGMYRGNTSGLTWFRVRSVGALTGTPLVRIQISDGTAAVFLNASLPTGTSTIGSVILTDGTTTAKILPASTAAVATDTPQVVALHPSSPVAAPAITKGTQGATGFTTQDLKDAGRTRISIVFQAVAPATGDTLLSLVKYTQGVAAAGATSIAVASGKRLRLTSLHVSLKNNAAAVASCTVTIRSLATGATVLASPAEFRYDLGLTAATVADARTLLANLPDGTEYTGAETLGVSLLSSATTNIMSITLSGFEY